MCLKPWVESNGTVDVKEILSYSVHIFRVKEIPTFWSTLHDNKQLRLRAAEAWQQDIQDIQDIYIYIYIYIIWIAFGLHLDCIRIAFGLHLDCIRIALGLPCSWGNRF